MAVIVTIYLRRAINSHIDEVDTRQTPSNAELAAQIEDLQHQLSQLHPQTSPKL